MHYRCLRLGNLFVGHVKLGIFYLNIFSHVHIDIIEPVFVDLYVERASGNLLDECVALDSVLLQVLQKIAFLQLDYLLQEFRCAQFLFNSVEILYFRLKAALHLGYLLVKPRFVIMGYMIQILICTSSILRLVGRNRHLSPSGFWSVHAPRVLAADRVHRS